jgi:hypothetical protein
VAATAAAAAAREAMVGGGKSAEYAPQAGAGVPFLDGHSSSSSSSGAGSGSTSPPGPLGPLLSRAAAATAAAVRALQGGRPRWRPPADTPEALTLRLLLPAALVDELAAAAAAAAACRVGDELMPPGPALTLTLRSDFDLVSLPLQLSPRSTVVLGPRPGDGAALASLLARSADLAASYSASAAEAASRYRRAGAAAAGGGVLPAGTTRPATGLAALLLPAAQRWREGTPANAVQQLGGTETTPPAVAAGLLNAPQDVHLQQRVSPTGELTPAAAPPDAAAAAAGVGGSPAGAAARLAALSRHLLTRTAGAGLPSRTHAAGNSSAPAARAAPLASGKQEGVSNAVASSGSSSPPPVPAADLEAAGLPAPTTAAAAAAAAAPAAVTTTTSSSSSSNLLQLPSHSVAPVPGSVHTPTLTLSTRDNRGGGLAGRLAMATRRSTNSVTTNSGSGGSSSAIGGQTHQAPLLPSPLCRWQPRLAGVTYRWLEYHSALDAPGGRAPLPPLPGRATSTLRLLRRVTRGLQQQAAAQQAAAKPGRSGGQALSSTTAALAWAGRAIATAAEGVAAGALGRARTAMQLVVPPVAARLPAAPSTSTSASTAAAARRGGEGAAAAAAAAKGVGTRSAAGARSITQPQAATSPTTAARTGATAPPRLLLLQQRMRRVTGLGRPAAAAQPQPQPQSPAAAAATPLLLPAAPYRGALARVGPGAAVAAAAASDGGPPPDALLLAVPLNSTMLDLLRARPALTALVQAAAAARIPLLPVLLTTGSEAAVSVSLAEARAAGLGHHWSGLAAAAAGAGDQAGGAAAGGSGLALLRVDEAVAELAAALRLSATDVMVLPLGGLLSSDSSNSSGGSGSGSGALGALPLPALAPAAALLAEVGNLEEQRRMLCALQLLEGCLAAALQQHSDDVVPLMAPRSRL